jgi:hypothetical protein
MGVRYFILLLTLPLLAGQTISPGIRLPNIPARDASMLADADSRTYYLYVSGDDSDGVMVYKSKDLANWVGPSSAFKVPDGSWANPAQGVRDPRVYAYRGKYYLFATLCNSDRIIARPPESWRVNTMQGTQIFVSDSPQGPFAVAANGANKPSTPADSVVQGGTLFVEGDLAYTVYAHDWTQIVDATIEATAGSSGVSTAGSCSSCTSRLPAPRASYSRSRMSATRSASNASSYGEPPTSRNGRQKIPCASCAH